ncbi:HD-GYP domain-containing protein [Sphingomonas cannabina]|uniref:HD-GYP domain-containing protein n=1 Tax=Sphingomonas cannabina TaxID=2899123 RepID=UPI001F1CE4DC|nr:HD-GYP domain-containing protein [Sphingomonas cannabina]UIJ44551.1 HD-GYP domain-containing protein [Sphingomonas cannabina]
MTPRRRKGDRVSSGGPAATQQILLESDWRPELSRFGGEQEPRPTRQRGPVKRKPSTRPTSFAVERKQAEAIVERSRTALIETFDEVRFGRSLPLDTLADVAEEIASSMLRNPFAITGLTRLRSRHDYTYVHSVGVCAFMVGLARELDIDESLINEIALAGLLHDIGKARVPVAVLDKAGPLTDDERATIVTHPALGHALLKRCGCDAPIVLDVCLHHHERFNGTGYPEGLAGEELSVFARIAAICDVYDAITSARPYKDSWSPAQALEWMTGVEGHFDRRMFLAFRRLVGAFPAGTLVRLASDRLAVVLDGGGGSTATPPVLTFHCNATSRAVPYERIDTAFDPIVAIERPHRWSPEEWEALRDRLLAHGRECGLAA